MMKQAYKAPSASPSIPWGVDSEYGVLTDVLLGPPDHLALAPVSAFLAAGDRAGKNHRQRSRQPATPRNGVRV